MKLWNFLIMLFISVMMAFSLAYANAEKKDDPHEGFTEEEKLIPCFECHMTETPKIYKEWYDSTHGIANVKCYQCHGTYENMKKTPELSTCAVCHEGKFVKKHTRDKKCEECHSAHIFKAKNKK